MNEWVWSNGGMILTGEMWSTGRKSLNSVGVIWMNDYGAMVERYWQGKTEVLREKKIRPSSLNFHLSKIVKTQTVPRRKDNSIGL